jgi:hypothetical protein
MILTNGTVTIALNLESKVSGAIEKVEKKLDKLDNKQINPDLEIDDNGDIAETQSKLETLDAMTIRPDLEIGGEGELSKVKTMKESLSGTETVHMNVVDDNDYTRPSLSKQRELRESGSGPAGSRFSTFGDSPLTKAERNGLHPKITPGVDYARKNEFKDLAGNIPPQVSRSQLKQNLQSAAQRGKTVSQRANEQVEKAKRPGAVTGRRGANIDYLKRFQKTNLTNSKLSPLKQYAATNINRKDAVRSAKQRTTNKDNPYTGEIRNFLKGRSGPGMPNPDGDGDGDGFEGPDRGISSLFPSSRFVSRARALLLAAGLSVAQALAGVLTAMAAHVGALVAIGGLGVMGMGENPAQAKKMAGARMNIAGRETFQQLQPATTKFAPAIDRLLEQFPSMAGGITDELSGLEDFIPSLQPAVRGMVEFVGELVAKMSDLSDQVIQLSTRFADMLGSGIIDLFEWLIVGASDTQNEFVQMMKTFKKIIVVVLQFAMIWGQVMTILYPVINLLGNIAKILNNDLMVGLLQFVLVWGLVTKAILAAVAAHSAYLTLAGGGGALTAIQRGVAILSAKFYQLTAAITTARGAFMAFLATTGVGLVLAAVGTLAAKAMTPSGGGGGSNAPAVSANGPSPVGSRNGGGGDVIHHYSMNVEGNTDQDTMNKFEDMARGKAAEEIEVQENAEK